MNSPQPYSAGGPFQQPRKPVGASSSNPPSRGSTYRPSQQSGTNSQVGAQWSTDPKAPAYTHTQETRSADSRDEKVAREEPELEEKPHVLPPKVVRHHRWRLFWWGLRYFLVAVIVGVALLIPVIVYRNDADADDEMAPETKQYNNLVFYLFLWLLISWVAYIGSDILALALPYVFRLVTRYINPAFQKYWRIFKVLRRPITYLGTTIFTYIFFTVLINYNDLLVVNYNKDPSVMGWDDIIDDILEQLTLWVCFYFVEKILILYITIHWHYRADNVKIARSKDVHNALMTLYEASVYLHPLHSGAFDVEDSLIRNAKGDLRSSARVRATSYLARMGIDGYKLVSLFGNFVDDDPKSHWLRPASSYATVERALTNTDSAAALGKRIWQTFAVRGQEGMTADDIAEVLGPFRKEEAKAIFKILDQNESGDIRLEDMMAMVVEAGQIRHNIYRSMHDIDHCINTLDWVLLIILAAVMIFFIMVFYVPTIKQIQETLGYLAIGLAFAVGRTFNHFLQGCVFVFFDHPYDIGDRVEIYNPGSTQGTAAVVKRQSVLYTVFRRLDNNTDLQISNERLSFKRIENFTRSGINRQSLSLFVDFTTSFCDIKQLRTELENFLAEPDNARDYAGETLAVSIVNLHELNKMELRVGVTHKSNWADEKLRAGRANKFHCALVAACRRIPLYTPGGAIPKLGEGGKPMYTVMVPEGTQDKYVKAEVDRRAGLRWDAPGKEEEEDKSYAIPESHGGMSDEEIEELRRVRDEADKKAIARAKAAAAREAEEEAFAKLTKTPGPAKRKSVTTAVSTSVEVNGEEQAVVGMRIKSNSSGQEYTR